ncbi:MAG: hypothetical protein ABI576_18155 [Flavobacterium sp.]
MKKLSFIAFAICLIFASCSNDENSQEEDSEKLEKMYNEIIVASLANSQTCTNPEEWDFTVINSSACGEDFGFIAYLKKINTVEFLNKVKKYQEAQIEFQTKWKIFSTCDIRVAPTGVACVDGKPKLTYSIASFNKN